MPGRDFSGKDGEGSRIVRGGGNCLCVFGETGYRCLITQNLTSEISLAFNITIKSMILNTSKRKSTLNKIYFYVSSRKEQIEIYIYICIHTSVQKANSFEIISSFTLSIPSPSIPLVKASLPPNNERNEHALLSSSSVVAIFFCFFVFHAKPQTEGRITSIVRNVDRLVCCVQACHIENNHPF